MVIGGEGGQMIEKNKARSGYNELARRLPAFTLVELLVVVSIIALLISILLPSLRNAREQAKTVKCQATTAGLGKAATTYGAEENEWIAGSPGTTGSILLGKYGTDGLNAAQDFELMPEAPVQVWDWSGPLAVYAMGMQGLPSNRADRWRQLVEGVFECPSNRLLSAPYFESSIGPHGNFKPQRMVSINTVRNFLGWKSGEPFPQAGIPLDGVAAHWPSGFKPSANRVGQPSEKILFTDSSRYTDDAGEIDHDIAWNAGYGGAFSTGGPTLQYLPNDSNRSYLRSFFFEDPKRKFSYRHAKGKEVGIVTAFFDGHAEWLSENTSRNPNYWWPKGTYIPRQELNKPAQDWVGRNGWEREGEHRNCFKVRR